ncbi:peptidase M24 [Lentinula aff. detonsa]|uniref:Peptidase M24 n=1 Tax=Lentinula aff. detonsa TaxID=2804958 RepID=A0AA38NIC3_9AGAR|nr:peptidase M24 [Lentinula aff. detonsa]
MSFHFLRNRVFLRACVRSYATELSTAPIKPSIYGQPLFLSHSHLIKPEELTPGIHAQEYEDRRRNLMNRLPDNSVVVSLAGTVQYMSGKIFYKFRQASDFWYLTGFEEPDSAVILEKNHSARGFHMTLFSSGSDSNKEQWDGASTTFSDARKIFQVDDARHIDDLLAHLRSVIPRYSNVYFDLPPSRTRRSTKGTTKSLLKYLSGRSESDVVIESLGKARPKPLAPEIGRLRAIKSPSEQNLMKSAADISGRAHAKTMRFTRPGLSEAALAAHFNYLCSLSGAQRLAYVPVVASGPNALIIHYTHNNQLISQEELILIDAGCEYNGYASDITRTYPANGTFTQPQRDLYSAVLSAQKALVALCHEGSDLNLYELHRKSCELLRQELLQLGFHLHPGDLERLYPHFISHPIGIDLHESDSFTRSGSLQAGMVVTVEPGIYVPSSPAFPKHFHGLGIRIEDEVLVGKDHPVVLSVSAPKEIVDVEGACQGLLGLEPL